MDNLVGKIVKGQYKRAGRPSSEIAAEVSAHAVISDSRGVRRPYLLVTRMDVGSAGEVQLLRTQAFHPTALANTTNQATTFCICPKPSPSCDSTTCMFRMK